ncbi:WAV2 [Symbiodinium natans]|uniref:WAV2 protein n=1 Tax=Symbiodinium natans TaxID=878477 RepID=A0A812LCP1_9DINO|nr:WAV2 [Symbiodinium natans]
MMWPKQGPILGGLERAPEPKQEEKRRPAVLFFHSNAGDIAQRLDFFKRCCRHLDVVVLALEYRGYGRSENGGGCSEPSFVEDAAAAYEWLVTYAASENSVVDPSRIFVFGRSLGGCVTVRLVAHLLGASPELRQPRGCAQAPPLPLPAGLILENSPSSIAAVVRHLLPPLRLLPANLLSWPLLLDEWRSRDWLDWIGSGLAELPERPKGRLGLCLLSAANDQVVPASCMSDLCHVAKTHRATLDTRFHSFARGEHMNTYQIAGAAYWEPLHEFIHPPVVTTEKA